MVDKVIIREGYPVEFSAAFSDGIGAQYTAGVFQIRQTSDADSPLVAGCDESSGLLIDHGLDEVFISMGATSVDDMGVNGRSKEMVGEIMLFDPGNDDDRIGGQFPAVIIPKVAKRG